MTMPNACRYQTRDEWLANRATLAGRRPDLLDLFDRGAMPVRENGVTLLPPPDYVTADLPGDEATREAIRKAWMPEARAAVPAAVVTRAAPTLRDIAPAAVPDPPPGASSEILAALVGAGDDLAIKAAEDVLAAVLAPSRVTPRAPTVSAGDAVLEEIERMGA